MEIEKGRAGIVIKEMIEEDIKSLKACGGQPPFVLMKHPALYIIGEEDLTIPIVNNEHMDTFEYIIVNPDLYVVDGVCLADIIDLKGTEQNGNISE